MGKLLTFRTARPYPFDHDEDTTNHPELTIIIETDGPTGELIHSVKDETTGELYFYGSRPTDQELDELSIELELYA